MDNTETPANITKLYDLVHGNRGYRQGQHACAYGRCFTPCSYVRETWALYSGQKRRIDGFGNKRIKRIMKYHWGGRVSY